MKDYSIKPSKEIMNRIEDAINTTSFHPNDVAEFMVNGAPYECPMHRYLQNQFFCLATSYIYELAKAYKDGYYDARNEYACKTANEIVEMIGKYSGDDSQILYSLHHFELQHQKERESVA